MPKPKALVAGCGLLLCLQAQSLLAQSAARGQTLFETRCVACHSLASNRVGPALGGVVGRHAGRAPGFVYSSALAAATHTWDAASLKLWLTNPEDLLPGQVMNYRVEQAVDRDDIVAYLGANK